MKAGGQRESAENQRTFVQRIVWLVLVVLVPLLAAIIMVGVALQIIGVPVWKTALQYIGMAPKTSIQTPLNTTQDALTIANQKIGVLTLQNQKLQASLTQAEATSKSLQSEVANLQQQVNTNGNVTAQAKQEAQVLVGMDPAPAADVLSKLSITEAAEIVAQMAPSDAAGILAKVDPTTAGKILNLAAQDAAQNATIAAAAANTTSNQTG